MSSDDLQVQEISDALQGKTIDVIVSGSIGAVESIRFIRALRRVGCGVQAWMTEGAAQFTTETALSWASARPCKRFFEGSASHIALHDACVVAPASANFISQIAQGLTSSPTTALLASYLGQGKPVFFLPNMHESLAQSPFVAANIDALRKVSTFLAPRIEEGKQKFPDAATLADELAHRLLLPRAELPLLLLTMGTTRGYIDSIRYISNYSSGALGTQIAHEFYRQGFPVHVVSGPCPHQPRSYTKLYQVETNQEMEAAVRDSEASGAAAAIFAASVLDFVPSVQREGKIRSSEELRVDFVKTPKIIASFDRPSSFKVGFKLESERSAASAGIALDYLNRHSLSHLVMNIRSDVSMSEHKATVFRKDGQALEVVGKAGLARYLAREALRVYLKQ